MNDSTNLTTCISVDIKKYRIRLHKAMLHLLGNPSYVQLLVNPTSRIVAIKAITKQSSGDQSHRINKKALSSDNSVEIYSRAFVLKLHTVMPELNEGSSYRIFGKIVLSEKIAVFPLQSIQCITNE